jgi:hypothetical protein
MTREYEHLPPEERGPRPGETWQEHKRRLGPLARFVWFPGDVTIIPPPATVADGCGNCLDERAGGDGSLAPATSRRTPLNYFPVDAWLGVSAFDSSIRFRLPTRTGEELPFCIQCREPDGHHAPDCARGRIEASVAAPFNVKRIGPGTA